MPASRSTSATTEGVELDAGVGQTVWVDGGMDHATPEVDIRVLGPLGVRGPLGPVDVRYGIPRSLLSMLLVRVGELVDAHVLIDELWFDRLPANPANALQVQVSYLRRQLRPLDPLVRIERRGFGYCLLADVDSVDSQRFERVVENVSELLLRSSTTSEVVDALSGVDDALSWWRGPAFADAAQLRPVESEQRRLESLRVVALEQRGVLLDRLGRHGEAAAWLEPLADAHPLREGISVALIGALYRDGRQAEALRRFGLARDRLVDEVGLEPGPELRRLERAILDHDPQLRDSLTTDDLGGPVRRTAPTTQTPTEPVSGPPPLERQSRLPESVTTLIGRGWEVDQVSELLMSHRLLTLVGTGGIGKSRLALEVARHLTVPVTVVQLGGVTDGEAVARLIASSIPVPTDSTIGLLDVVASRIGDDDWVIVLDTCEHLIDTVAATVADLLGRCRRLKVLATSRRSLGLDGEVAWPVPLLELADTDARGSTEVGAAPAIRLFVERARATDPTFALDDTNARAVADICRSLDGLPLAIELAAARIRVLSPEAIRDRLADRFRLLTMGRRDSDARQHSLEAAVSWSYEQLDEPEKQFFEWLGLFGGAFDLHSAGALANVDDLDAVDLMSVLIDRSLVVSEGHDTFRMLDTLRAYARARLDERDPTGQHTSEANRRLATWMANLGISVDPSLMVDKENIRAALDWAFGADGEPTIGARIIGSMAGSLALTGDFADADRWLRLALQAECDDETTARVWRGVAVIAMYQSQFSEASAAGEAAYQHAVESGNGRLVAVCAITLGSAVWGIGELDRSATLLHEAAEFFDASGEIRGRGLALARLARTLADLRDPNAVKTAAAAVDDLEASQDDWIRVVALDHLAYALLADDDYEAAAARAEQAVELAERIGSFSGRFAALKLLAKIRFLDGDLQRATETYRRIVTTAVRVRNHDAIADALEGLADVMIESGHPELAARVVGSAHAARARGTRDTDTNTVDGDRREQHLERELGRDQLARERRAGWSIAALEAFDLIPTLHTAP